MALKDNVKHLRELLAQVTHDLEKAERGNKAASQRVRTATVRLEKVAKSYRKESIKSEKSAPKGSKKASAKKVVKAKATKSSPAKSHAKAKPKAHKASARPRALSFRKSTAKIPHRKHK